MSSIASYINSLKRVDRVINSKAEGLSHADSMAQLPFPGNCMNWNIGHILVYRMQYLGVIDGVSKPDAAEFAIYGGGSEPLTDGDKAIPLPELFARIESSSAQVIAALEQMPPEKLAQVYDEKTGATVGDRLDFYLVFHEAYHAGQLEPLRELALAQQAAAQA